MTIKQRYSPKVLNKPYLHTPIKDEYLISEGYIYSVEERALHGNFFHKGIDYSCRYKTPVYAAASGYAVATYHRFPVMNNDYTLRCIDGEPIGNGLGYFVQILHPEKVCGIAGGRITQYGHLSSFANAITPFMTKPILFNHIHRLEKHLRSRKSSLSDSQIRKILSEQATIIEKYPWTAKYYGYHLDMEEVNKEIYLYSEEELKDLIKKKSPYVIWVEQGDIIGYVGISAVFRGKPNYSENAQFPAVREPSETWDEYHLHFEEATRDWETGKKKLQRDPYGIYKSSIWYDGTFENRGLFID